MDLNLSELVEVGLDAVAADAQDVPAGMAGRILDATRATARPPLHPDWSADGSRLSSHAAFITTAAELCRLLDGLDATDWSKRADVDGGITVRDLVLHLTGVERYMLGQLGRRPTLDAPTPAHHFPVLRAAASDLDATADARLPRAWWLEVLDLIAATGELGPQHPIAYHDLAGSVGGMLVIRTFELWTHDDDIRRAVGLPLNLLDDERLSLMSTTLLDVLPFGMERAGTVQPGRTVQIELTGSGGGSSFVAALSPQDQPGRPDLVIRTSALDLCRLASNRMSIDEIDVRLEGDESLLRPVLAGAGAFAMD